MVVGTVQSRGRLWSEKRAYGILLDKLLEEVRAFTVLAVEIGKVENNVGVLFEVALGLEEEGLGHRGRQPQKLGHDRAAASAQAQQCLPARVFLVEELHRAPTDASV